MQHLDEGTIHAWLDGALSAEESARVEAHVASCESCGALVAEARGLVAASSRILAALDNVPRNVIPASTGAAADRRTEGRRGGGFRGWQWKRIAAVIAFVAVGGTALRIAVGEYEGASDAMSTAPAALRVDTQTSATAQAEKVGAPVESAPTVANTAAADEAPVQAAASAPAPAPARVREERAAADAQGRGVTGTAAVDEARKRFAVAAPPDSARSVVEGRVIDARTGNALASARVELEGTRAGAITDDSGAFRITGAPQGEQQLRVLRMGYEAQERDIETKAGKTVSVDVALEPASSIADRVVTTGEAMAVRPVASTIVGLEAISRDTVVEDGRMVETSVYELRPGVSVTLRVATAIGDRRDADLSQRAAARPAPPPAASLQRGARASQPAVRSMRWVTPTGAEVTLSGAVAEEELGRVRERVAVP